MGQTFFEFSERNSEESVRIFFDRVEQVQRLAATHGRMPSCRATVSLAMASLERPWDSARLEAEIIQRIPAAGPNV